MSEHIDLSLRGIIQTIFQPEPRVLFLNHALSDRWSLDPAARATEAEIVLGAFEAGLNSHPTKSRLFERKRDMPASYEGDALHGGKKVDGVNTIVGNLLERGAKMEELQKALTDIGRRENAARQHLTFLEKNGQRLFVNGEPYQKGHKINPGDWITLNS